MHPDFPTYTDEGTLSSLLFMQARMHHLARVIAGTLLQGVSLFCQFMRQRLRPSPDSSLACAAAPVLQASTVPVGAAAAA